ncbi:MAG: stalk domain-containing protein [Firmicutes bacterium]|nr:stalk domain-containing protein [Bacillota bacterium]
MKKVLVLTVAMALILLSGTTVLADNSQFVKHGVINEDDDYCHINVVTPIFEGFSGAGTVNHIIRDIVIDSIGHARTAGIQLKEFRKKTELVIYYDYSKYDDLLSVQLNTYIYLGGAHGSSEINPITINTATGDVYNFKDLFQDEVKGVGFVEEYILETIKENPEAYFEDYEERVKSKEGDFDYYLNGDNLVVYFGQYDIGPYASGIRYFEINAGDIKDILKDEIYNSIVKGRKKGLITYNTLDINSKNEIKQTDDWISMVPLRDIAESLGYKVDWNKEDGAIVAGGFIKPGIGSYSRQGSEAIEMTPPTIENGVTYVPLDYFTKVLEENVIYAVDSSGEPAIKIFSKEGVENNFDKLIKGFSLPLSGEEAVKMYGEAIKNRNGVFQYGLLSDKLKKEKYNDFEGFFFVTGVSSPWVDSYEITNTGENTYDMDLTYRTSVPGESFIETMKIVVNNVNEYWNIDSIEYIE